MSFLRPRFHGNRDFGLSPDDDCYGFVLYKKISHFLEVGKTNVLIQPALFD